MTKTSFSGWRKLALALAALGCLAAPAAQSQTAAPYTTYYNWDVNRRLIMAITPDPGTGVLAAVKNTYDVDGQLIETDKGTTTVTTGSNFTAVETTTYAYDVAGNKIQTTVLNGTATPALSLTQVTYDADDRPVCSAQRMNPSAYGSLAAVNNGSLPTSACSQTTAGAFGPDLITATVYCDGGPGLEVANCAAGQVYQEQRAVGTALSQAYETFTYTANGKQASLTDMRGNATNFSYDGFDRLLTNSYADGTSEANAYDANSNVLVWTNRGGYSVVRGYDNLNRKICEQGITGGSLPSPGTCTVSGGTTNTAGRWWDIQPRTFAYDLMGHKTQAANATLNLAWTYDAAGRPATYSDGLGSHAYTYDGAGNLTQFVSAGGFVNAYAYDALNHMTGASLQRPGVDASPISAASLQYDSLGRRQLVTFADSSTETYVYDNADRPISIAHAFPSFTSDNVTFAFSYDPAGRDSLTNINNSLYALSPPALYTTYAAADSVNRYSTVGASSISYWAEGGVGTDGTAHLSNYYDETGFLVLSSSTATANNSATSQPDALGQAVFRQKMSPAGSPTGNPAGTDSLTYYSSDGLRPEHVADQVYTAPDPATGSNWTSIGYRYYVNGPGPDERLAFVDTNNAIYYPHADRQGSTIALSTTGYAVATHAYGPYGETPDPVTVTTTGASAYPFRYTGQRYDSDYGLYNYKARTYSPALGRFYQNDPSGYGDGPNLYEYVADDPVDRTDPSGLEAACVSLGQDCLSGPTAQDEANFQANQKIVGPYEFVASLFLPGGVEMKGVAGAGRVFWSGGPAAMRAATEWAAVHGGTTLEQTFTGKALTALTNVFGFKNTEGLWKAASAAFAKGAKGDVNVFLGETVRPNSVWNTVEKGILEKGGNSVVEHPVPSAAPASGPPGANGRGPIAPGCFFGGHGICPL